MIADRQRRFKNKKNSDSLKIIFINVFYREFFSLQSAKKRNLKNYPYKLYNKKTKKDR